jgi:uncharacterized membrane protein YdjX (TVP38/TMEM64 family)
MGGVSSVLLREKMSDQAMALESSGENEVPSGDLDRLKKRYVIAPLVALLVGGAVWVASGSSPLGVVDMSTVLDRAVDKIAASGPYGYLYFSLVYIAAEMLAIPVFPLTASSGYLFGLLPGYATVLVSATIAAMASFLIGRTFLREWATQFTSKWPKWQAIDKAIAKEGLKVILLLRLSPLLPFSLSNYLYGITSVDLRSFSIGTLLGFAPGTFGIVYAGTAGKALFDAGESGGFHAPWYLYAVGGALVVGAARTLAKVATDAINEMEMEMRASGELKEVREE